MDEEQRVALGRHIQAVREQLFGTVAAAARRADVDVQTFAKAERGAGIRSDTRRKIVRTLWPYTGGDWTKIEDGDPTHTTIDELDDDALAQRASEGAQRVTDDVAEIARRLRARRAHGQNGS